MSVNRCYSEKKTGFDVEARSLFSSLHDLLEIKNLTHVRYPVSYTHLTLPTILLV